MYRKHDSRKSENRAPRKKIHITNNVDGITRHLWGHQIAQME